MAFRTRTWCLLSVMLFITAVFFWRLGDERVAGRRSAQEQPFGPAKVQRLIPQPHPPRQSPFASNAVGQAFLPVPAPNATNLDARFPYRLRNTPDSIGQLSRNDKAILLRNALIDTTRGNIAIPAHLRAPAEGRSFIVQARGVIDQRFRSELQNAGAEIVSYIPNNAVLVEVPNGGGAALRAITTAQAILPYEPYYKLDPQLIELAVKQQDLEADTALRVTVFPGKAKEAIRAFEAAGATLLSPESERSPFGPIYTLKPAPGSLVALAQSPVAELIEPYHKRVLLNDLTRVTLGVSADTIAPTNYLNLTGSNVLVNVNDSGVDASNPDLAGRMFSTAPGALVDFDGHGTHVIGIIASSGSNSPTVLQNNVPGSVPGANFRGKAPAAKIFALPIDLITGPLLSDTYLQETAAKTNAFISNNSWGYIAAREYNSAAASYDAAVRDALPGVTGSQPLLYVFAAGNSGSGDENGLNALADTVVSPGTAKNVITVGALESLRNITNEVVTMEGTNQVTNAVFKTMTDSDSQVAFYSSRGNVGIGLEGDVGRFKPDVVAPGSFIVSTRSTNWVDPGAGISIDFNVRAGEVVLPGQTNTYPITIPNGATNLLVRVRPNALSPDPFPPLPIYVGTANPVAPGDLRGNGFVSVPVTPGDWFYGVGNPTRQPVNFDVETYIIIATPDDSFAILKQLNDVLAPYYRFESGTSMAAPAISGVLALMQEFFEQHLKRTNSPALMKALLINGADPVSSIYDYSVRTFGANHQGWGLPNIQNIIPASLASGTNESAWPIRFWDQSPTNALATGESFTRTFSLSSQAQGYPLRLTLVWTDPPGNPAASLKLVNDLDLIVTNLDTTNVYIGNNFVSQDNFTPADGSAPSDVVNNVENIFLSSNEAPLGSRYSVTVRARRVNVNAVTAHTNGIVQDFALVISAGNPNLTSAFTFSDPPVRTIDTNSILLGVTNGVPLLNQHVGANPPLYPSTNGLPVQWNFYVFTNSIFKTNTGTFGRATNVGFVTFFPPDLSRPRLVDADIDLYVSTDPTLTNLNPAAVGAAFKSTGRSGTETVIFTNADAIPDVFFVGVKSEDQQGAEFGLFAVATDTPFSQRDQEGNLILNGVPVQGVDIPDGSPSVPRAGLFFALASEPDQIRRVVVTNTITHELIGDLFGQLNHEQRSVVLNSHTSTGTNQTQLLVYDDSGQGDILGARATDGPGSLNDFVGERATGAWLLTMVDNAESHTGRLDNLTIKLEPRKETNGFSTATILANRFFFDFVDVLPDTTNLVLEIQTIGSQQGPVEAYLREGALPDRVVFDKTATIAPPGGFLTLGPNDAPPLVPGVRYYAGFFNPNSFTVQIRYRFIQQRSLRPIAERSFGSPTNTVVLPDDAATNAVITITNAERVISVDVGVRINHPRASDLVLHLVSPQGTRILLTENRGGTNTAGYGTDATGSTTNFVNIIGSDFETVPARLYPRGAGVEDWSVATNTVSVVGDTNAFHGRQYLDLGTGAVARAISTFSNASYVLSYAYRQSPAVPGSVSTRLSVSGVLTNVFTNDFAGWKTNVVAFSAPSNQAVIRFEGLGSGAWLDAIVLNEQQFFSNSIYTVFTENTNLAQIPIKFAEPPFANTNIGGPFVIFTNDFEGIAAGDYFPVTNNIGNSGWNVVTNFNGSNRVTVINDYVLAYTGSNVMALRDGALSRILPTTNGRNYRLEIGYRRSPELPGLISWWQGNGTNLDALDRNHAAWVGNPPSYVTGKVDRAFNLDGTRALFVTNSASLFSITNLTLDAWIYLNASGTDQTILSKDDGSLNRVFRLSVNPANRLQASFGILGFGYQTVVGPSALGIGQWYHVAFTYDGAVANLYVNGILDAQAFFAPGGPLPQLAQHLYIGAQLTNGAGVVNPFIGRIDEPAIYNRALSAAEIKDIFDGGSLGRCNTLNPPGVCPVLTELAVQGMTNSFGADTNAGWLSYSTLFRAVSNDTQLTIRALDPGMLLDTLVVTDVGNWPYYFPEESLKNIFGENALGQWKLEVWDDRAGAFVDPRLISWQLNFVFAPPLTRAIPLTNAVPYTGSVPAGQFAYFSVRVPASASFATNILRSASGPVNIWFDQNGLPTGSLPGDVLLFSGAAGSATLSTNSFPPLVPGQTYYLGVQPFGGPTSFTIEVDFDRTDDFLNVIPLTNGVGLATNILAGPALNYYQFDVSSNATSVAFEILNPNGNVDLVLRRGAPLPSPSDYHYLSANPGLANEYILVTSNSPPVPLAPGRWYLGVYNLENRPVAYTVRATEFTGAIGVITLSNGVPYTGTATPGASFTNYFRFVIDQTNSAALFELYNLSGNADLIVRRGSFPNILAYDGGSFAPGTNDEQIVVRTNSVWLDLNGDWFLAVPNNEATNVTFTIRATVSTNGILPGAPPQFTGPPVVLSDGSIELTWNSISGESYEVQESQDLVTWTTLAVITATGSVTTYRDASPPPGMNFYRVIHVPPP